MSAENSSPVALSDRERDTVLAALRLWQMWQDNLFKVAPSAAAMLEAVADEHGPGLVNEEIDMLIERKLNV